jgi:MarR family transcriptional regulator, organic hydroperoxide resistance regulator
MLSTIDGLNCLVRMKYPKSGTCEAWLLLLEFLASHRAYLPPLAAELQLSPAQCHVLRLIEPGQAIPMGRLAANLACDASNVTGLVDRLEARGLVYRRPSERDRRVKVLGLTPKGARLRATLLDRMTEPPENLNRLSPDEQQTLVNILKRLLD